MPMQIIKHRERVLHEKFLLSFESTQTKGCGYSFECNENGKIKDPADQPAIDAIIADGRYHAPRIIDCSNSYVEPAIGLCECGKKVTLEDALENECECGRAYNMSGQEVKANYSRMDCVLDGWSYDEDY